MNLPRGGLRGGDEAGAGNRQTVLIENGQVLGGRSEVGAVQDVEQFGAELSVKSFRNALQRIVLED